MKSFGLCMLTVILNCLGIFMFSWLYAGNLSSKAVLYTSQVTLNSQIPLTANSLVLLFRGQAVLCPVGALGAIVGPHPFPGIWHKGPLN